MSHIFTLRSALVWPSQLLHLGVMFYRISLFYYYVLWYILMYSKIFWYILIYFDILWYIIDTFWLFLYSNGRLHAITVTWCFLLVKFPSIFPYRSIEIPQPADTSWIWTRKRSITGLPPIASTCCLVGGHGRAFCSEKPENTLLNWHEEQIKTTRQDRLYQVGHILLFCVPKRFFTAYYGLIMLLYVINC